MAIQRSQASSKGFSVGLNVILTGSKKMSAQEQEAAMEVSAVRVLIVDANDPENVLVDETAPATEFSTGSVGYKVNARGVNFERVEAHE